MKSIESCAKRFSSFCLVLLFLVVQIIFSSACRPKEEGFSFVFYSDVHLQTEKNAVQGFDKALTRINDLQPDFVISGGDNITDALAQSYETADGLYNLYQKSTAALKAPLYNVPGNHDVFGVVPESGVSPEHPEFGKKMFTNRLGKLYQSFDFKGWHFILLDSVLITEDGRYKGGVDDAQMEWLKQHLAGVDPAAPIVVATHVPFYSTIPQRDPRFKTDVFLIKNSTAVLDLFKNHNLKLVLQGHVHYHEVIQAGGIYFITGGAVCGAWWDGPLHGSEEGFLHVKISGDDLTWEYVDYGWSPPDGVRHL